MKKTQIAEGIFKITKETHEVSYQEKIAVVMGYINHLIQSLELLNTQDFDDNVHSSNPLTDLQEILTEKIINQLYKKYQSQVCEIEFEDKKEETKVILKEKINKILKVESLEDVDKSKIC